MGGLPKIYEIERLKGMMEHKIQQVIDEVEKVVKGKTAIVEKVLCTMLAGGHILLEDIPGVGKTTLAMTVAKAVDLSYKRVQFTPDVLPSDLVGFSMYNNVTREFEYRPGAIFANLFLADEINRTSPKTQSALLEAMEEGKVTVDGKSHDLPAPFTVIATQNPVGSSGTQMLPESQLDRFMVCLSMGYPDHKDAVDILKNDGAKTMKDVKAVISETEWQERKDQAEICHVSDELYDYVIRITEETRKNSYIQLGASPRGGIALVRMARARAVMEGRDYVVPEDIEQVFFDVMGHRVKISSKAKAEGISVVMVLDEIFHLVKLR